MNRLQVGTLVVHNKDSHYGVGKIVGIQSKYQTVLVKWENVNKCLYHIPWSLEVHKQKKK